MITGALLWLLNVSTKGGSVMVDVYVTLIVKKRRTIDQVPEQLKAEVLADLSAMGLDGYGNPLEPAA